MTAEEFVCQLCAGAPELRAELSQPGGNARAVARILGWRESSRRGSVLIQRLDAHERLMSSVDRRFEC